MKNIFRKLFSPILNIFEKNNADYITRPKNRIILFAISILFAVLTIIFPVLFPEMILKGSWFVMLVFGSIGFVGLVVAIFGSDQAVAKLLGSR